MKPRTKKATIQDARKLRAKWMRKVRRTKLKARCGDEKACLDLLDQLKQYQVELHAMGFKNSPPDSPHGSDRVIPIDTPLSPYEVRSREMTRLALKARDGDTKAAIELLEMSMKGDGCE